jgi:uncharacterized protein YbjT (DUF2867 family)
MTQTRHTYTVMGATGHVGSVVAERLLKMGAQVRGIGRNSERLKGLVGQGAIPNRADSAVFWWAVLTLPGSDDCDPLTERSRTHGGS